MIDRFKKYPKRRSIFKDDAEKYLFFIITALIIIVIIRQFFD